MIVLLPPSENKATRSRGVPLDLPSLSWADELTAQRSAVLDALASVSAGPDAARILGVSPTLTDEIARNTHLRQAPTLPASALYAGVLYDALDLPTLERGPKTRAARRIIISSALYGAVRLGDRLAPYRLSMGVNLPGVGPLASAWKHHLDAPLREAAGDGLVVDCRSSTYAASWSPTGAQREQWVHVRVPGATHMAKHTRGLVARHLMRLPKDPTTPAGLAAALAGAFRTTLHEPASATKPWIIDVTAAT